MRRSMHWLLFLLWRHAAGLTLSPAYNFANSLQSFYQERSVEELATGTITIRGPFDDTVLQILQTTTEQTLKLFCAQGSILIFTELKVLHSGGGQRVLTMEFQILPPKDGGGDCAWELLQAAAGKDTQPFDDCEDCPLKKPIIRRAILNSLQMYSLTRGVSVTTWYLSMFSIYCRRLEVIMPRNFPSMTKKDYRCEDFFPEATRFPAPGDQSTTETPGTETTSLGAGGSEQSICTWMRDPCLCATVVTCSWLPDGDGVSRCTEVSTQPHLAQRCETCPTLPECPPNPARECPLALSICSCALLSAGCNWTVDEGRCFAPVDGPAGVPCALCPFAAESCPMPRVSSISPSFGAEMDSDINVTFDKAVRHPQSTDSIQGNMLLGCELQEGQLLPAQAPNNRRANFILQFPPNKRVMLSNQVVQLPLGEEEFWSSYECKLNISRAAMISMTDSVPCLENLNHVVFIRDNVPPRATTYRPRAAERDVSLDTSASITFNEPWSLLRAEAELWRLNANTGPGEYELVRKLQTAKAEAGSATEHLTIQLGDLEADRSFSIVIPQGALVDRTGNLYRGLQVGEWGFRTAAAVGLLDSADEGLSPGAVTGIVLGALALVGGLVLCIAIWRCKLIARFENRAVKPMEGGTPKAAQVSALQNDSDVLPSNEKFWEKALIKSKENLGTDELEDLPSSLPSAVDSRRPSRVSNVSNASNRRPSNASALNQRRPSIGSESQRRPSRTASDARRPSITNELQPNRVEPSNLRHHSKQSADSRGRRHSDATASVGLRSANLGVPAQEVAARSRSPSRSEGVPTGQGRTLEESENLAASRRAMLGAGPATLSKPTTALAPATRQCAT